jgi:hypothetical protein
MIIILMSGLIGQDGSQKHVNEQFFIGFSGRYKVGIFYLQHFGAMYHYAGKMDPVDRRTSA